MALSYCRNFEDMGSRTASLKPEQLDNRSSVAPTVPCSDSLLTPRNAASLAQSISNRIDKEQLVGAKSAEAPRSQQPLDISQASSFPQVSLYSGSEFDGKHQSPGLRTIMSAQPWDQALHKVRGFVLTCLQ